MVLCKRLGAVMLSTASGKGKLPAAHVAQLGRAEFRRSAATLIRRAPCAGALHQAQPQRTVAVLSGSHGGSSGWDGGSEGAGGETNAMWRLALASGAGLVLVVGQSNETQCQEGAPSPSAEELKIAKMCENKESGQQSSWMSKIEACGATVMPVINFTLEAIDLITPFIVKAIKVGRAIYNYLPTTIIEALGGLAMCFFGGLYPLTVAAVETFRVSGGTEALKYLNDIWEESKLVYKANKEDNKVDADGDGIADVKQMSAKAVATRKVSLVLKTINPSKLLEAYGGLAKAFAGVCATLKLQFAKVISLAVSIADAMRPVMTKLVGPIMVALVPKDYQKWISPLIDVFCKFVAGSIAWFLYRIVAAVHSGIVGGLICTRALMRFANEKKLLSWKHEDTMLDEYLGWAIAAVGVYYQVPRHMCIQYADIDTYVCADIHVHTQTHTHTHVCM